ncbi:unnamed protein product [Ceutorhynchus assimilis]|uniref:Zinc finger PHD-type domain-containing protein n=1 Tax=Ceutorhynchus assimilis TaxID=467358 RepID=A0A9N9MY15_9CUCU|nr:unnamed protein product [Ceutorhynchus assimilis]
MPKKNLPFIKDVKDALESLKPTKEDFFSNCRADHLGFYNKMCNILRLDGNIYKNRLKVSMVIKRNHLFTSTSSKYATSELADDEKNEVTSSSSDTSHEQNASICSSSLTSSQTAQTSNDKEFPKTDTPDSATFHYSDTRTKLPIYQQSTPVSSYQYYSNANKSNIIYTPKTKDITLNRYKNEVISEFYKKRPNNIIVLPIGSVNDGNLTRAGIKFNNCTFLEGVFQLTYNELANITNENKKLADYYLIIKRKFEEINNTCVLNFKKVSVNSNFRKYTIYGYCAHKKCKTFVLKIEKSDNIVNCSVFSSSLNFNHSPQARLTTYARKSERKLIGEDLAHSNPFMKRLDEKLKTPSSQILNGNLRDIKSEDVYRKIRHEEVSKLDRHQDEIFDLILMARENSYIYRVFEPLTVYIFSAEQLDILNFIKKGQNKIVLHLDATGQIVHQPPHIKNPQKIFYYAGVVWHSSTATICPILELITSMHDAFSIGSWLNAFQAYCMKNKLKWPIFSTIVTDFSFALMNAVNYYWNRLNDISEYLNICYNSLHENIPCEAICILKVCVCHLMKNIASDIEKLCSDEKRFKKVQKSLYKKTIASAFMMANLKSLEKWFSDLVKLTIEPRYTRSIADIVSNINNEVLVETDENFRDNFGCITDSEPEQVSSLYKKSKFYQHFLKIYESCNESNRPISETDVNNPYYLPDLSPVILKKYITFLPLWTNIITDETMRRYSNAPVENHFNKVKNTLIPQKNLRCSRFLRYSRELVLATHKQLTLDIPKNRCTRGKKKNIDKNLTMEVVETWRKKRKPKGATYFGPSSKILKTKDRLLTLVQELAPFDREPPNLVQEHSAPDALLKLYPNGNVSDVNYYNFKDFKFIVGIYPGAEPFEKLDSIDFQSLSGNNWFTNWALDIVFHILTKNRDINYIPQHHAHKIFTLGSYKFKESGMKISNKKQIICLDLQSQCHWCLVVCNVNQKLFYYINPTGSSLTETKNKMSVFLKKCSISENGWTPKILFHPKQKDSCSCGPYVTSFAVKIINGDENLCTCLEPEDQRFFLKELLLREASDMKDKCVVCGEDTLNITSTDLKIDWVQCDHCIRWYMLRCLNIDNTEELPSKYCCPICTFFFNRHTNN